MTINWGGFVGGIILRLLAGIRDMVSAWYNRAKLEEEEQRRKTLEAHHAAEKEREAAEARIAEAARLEKEKADKEAVALTHEQMLDHLRNNNK